MDKLVSCAILGHSPMRFAWGFDEEDDDCKKLKLVLLRQITSLRQAGVTKFLVACDCGVGLYAAELINILREADEELQLFCVAPHEEQATKWAPYLRERYFNMLEKCTCMTLVGFHKEPDCQFMACRSIIDQADIVLAVYDPESARGDDVDTAIEYAEHIGRQITMIHPDSLECVTIEAE